MNRIFTPLLLLSALLALPASAVTSGAEIRFTSAGIVCTSCVKKVVRVLRKDSRVKDARVDVDQHRVTIALREDAKLSDSELREIVAPTGFSVDAIER